MAFPDSWEIAINGVADAPKMDGQSFQEALFRPYRKQLLRDLARGRKTAAVAVEDTSRPVPLEDILVQVLGELRSGGLTTQQTRIVVCNGAHAPMSRPEAVGKLGKSIVDRFQVLNHNPYDNLCDTGISLGKTTVKLNRFFWEADLKIGIGTIMPHPFAGFSSGAKLLIPGLSDIETLERSHKYVLMGFRGGVDNVETNKFRLEIEEGASKIGLDFFVGLVPTSRREIAGVFPGHMVEAHRAGVQFARQVCRTEVRELYDVAVLNAYPKDTELLQADTAFTPLKSADGPFVKEGGVVVLTTRCSNGFGHHSLFGLGMRLHRKPRKLSFLQGRELIVYSPNINDAEFRSLYWEGYRMANKWEQVIDYLREKFPVQCKVGVFPCAPLQLVKCLF